MRWKTHLGRVKPHYGELSPRSRGGVARLTSEQRSNATPTLKSSASFPRWASASIALPRPKSSKF
jgi:hypothetical protein